MSQAKQKTIITKEELRRIMNEQKKKYVETVKKKIESPLAKYLDNGELRCILCNSKIRNESLWVGHISGKEHLANIAAAKKAKANAANEMPSTVKRPAPVMQPPQPDKKPKSILKNSTVTSSTSVPADFFDKPKPFQSPSQMKHEKSVKVTESKRSLITGYDSDEEEDKNSNPPGGIVPAGSLNGEKKEVIKDKKNKNNVPEKVDPLPEGFFDDPKLDAKARNVEYKDPGEEEWEKFQKAMKEEAEQSQQIIQEEQEEATAERQLEEIDEQMRNWSRVVDLERRKDVVVKHENNEDLNNADEAMDSDAEDNFDEFLDWRSKHS